MKLLVLIKGAYTTTKFFCIRCLRVRSSEGGNMSRHYQGKCMHVTQYFSNENIYSIILFCVNHYVPLTSISQDDGKEAFPNFHSYPKILSIIIELKNKIQNNIKDEIHSAKKVTIECDTWSHPKGIRYLGIVLRYLLDDSVVEAPVDLIETPDFTLGSYEMSSIIKSTMNKLQIARDKWLSLASDDANDMSKLASEMHLEWDRCVLHLLHLKIQCFWASAKERLQKVPAIASILHSKTNWNEFMLHHGEEFPELGKKRNFTIGTGTRWATHLEECKQLVQFKGPILTYQEVKWQNKHKIDKYQPDPNKHILISDFEMIEEILPLFESISSSFKLLESRELYLSKMAITICYIQDEIYEYVKKCHNGTWYDNCVKLIEAINEDILNLKCPFTNNLLAAVILDPFVTKIPDQINCRQKEIFDYIRKKMDCSNNETFSPPIFKNYESSLDPVEEKYCKPVNQVYDDELDHWYEKVRPNEIGHDNPYKYWKDHSGHQRLRKFALKLFVHAGSSVACEKFFSLCANMADDKRTRMTPENFSALCVVKANISRARKLLYED